MGDVFDKVMPQTRVKRAPKAFFPVVFRALHDEIYSCTIHGPFDALRIGDALPECPVCELSRQSDESFEPGTVSERPPKYEFGIRFAKQDYMAMIRCNDYANLMIKRYVTGDGFPGKTGWIPPEPLPPIDDQPVAISESTARLASMIFVSQAPVKESSRYTFEEIISHMIEPSVLNQMVEVSMRIPMGGEEIDPLAPRDSTSP